MWLRKVLRLLGIYPDDWRAVWTERASIHWTDVNVKDNFFYTIQFSESRDKFRLLCEGKSLGMRASEHKYYLVAMQKLAQYNNELLSIRFKSKAKTTQNEK